MNETDTHPLCYQGGLGVGDSSEESQIGIFSIGRIGIVPVNCVIGEFADFIFVAARCTVLKGPDANVTRRNPGENGTGKNIFPINFFPCGYGR